MNTKKISITFWGDGLSKEKWGKWYISVKNLMKKYGYPCTHIGIKSESYNTGKILTVSRKEKEILGKIKNGEKPEKFSCYSLPRNYEIAAFDYNFLAVRDEFYSSFIVNEEEYSLEMEQQITLLMKEFIDYTEGEVYITSNAESPLLYAITRDNRNIVDYKFVKKLN